MKIQSIKVNSYGNLKDKKIDLEFINIIYGKNESGKSTLINFIKNMFYGISKNKNGKEISDYDKYYPWNGDKFSGKIKYELETGEGYEVYRDFNRKDVQIYNRYMEDISSLFKIDKKMGSQFFVEQTGIDENTFISTALTSQRQVELDNTTQGNLLQKVANIVESGTEDVSYKKVLAELNTMMLTEVGNNNSKDRPINITKANINKYITEIEEISNVKENRLYIEKKINQLTKSIKEKEKEESILSALNEKLQRNKIEEEKINIKAALIEENKSKIRELDNNKDKLLHEIEESEKHTEDRNTNKRVNKTFSIIFLLLSIGLNIFNFIYIKNKMINIVLFILLLVSIINVGLKVRRSIKVKKKKIQKTYIQKSEIEKQMEVLDVKIDLLEKTNDEIEKEISALKNDMTKNINIEKMHIEKDYPNINATELRNSNLELLIQNNKRNLEDLRLEVHKAEFSKESIDPELERLLKLEEMLEIEKENLRNLETKAEEINFAKNLIDESYKEMKQNVTPRFSKILSENIHKVSNGKYQNVSINDGVIVELEDGKRVRSEELSIGTIEQIYLSLRLALINELSKEKMPIMLDEIFAYYDDERMKSALDFLSKTGHQIIIFTCTNREKEMLDSMKMQYKYIEL